jgi:hypothetical protein
MFNRLRAGLSSIFSSQTNESFGSGQTKQPNDLSSQLNFMLSPHSRAPPNFGTGELLEAYSNMPWLRAVAGKVGQAVGTTQWRLLVVRDEQGRATAAPKMQRSQGKDFRDRQIKQIEESRLDEIDEHPLLDLLNSGNDRMSGSNVFATTQIHLDLVGESFWLIERNSIGVPVTIWPLPPDWVRSLPRRDYPYYAIKLGNKEVEVPVTEVIAFFESNPANPYGRGAGIAQSLGDDLEVSRYATGHLKSFFYNSARPDLIVSADGLRKEETERLEEKWLEKHKGFFQCHDEETEVLTKEGWKNGMNITERDLVATWSEEKQRIEYQNPTYIHQYQYSGTMNHWTGPRVDALVTPNHRMWVGNRTFHGPIEWRFQYSEVTIKGGPIQFRVAGYYAGDVSEVVIPAVSYPGKGRPASGLDDELRMDPVDFAPLLGFIISEGCLHETTINVSQVTSGGAGKCDTIEAVRDSLAVIETGVIRADYGGWYINHKGLAQWCMAHVGKGEHNKRIPNECFDWPIEAKEALLEALILGDGYRAEGRKASAMYATVSRGLADDVQRLAIETGHRCWVSIATAKDSHSGKRTDYFNLRLCRYPKLTLQKGDNNKNWAVEVPYEGYVWCVTVPNSTVFTRRNGRVLVSGNSFKPQFMNRTVRVDQIGDNLDSLQMTQIRNQERDTIISVFGCPPEKLGVISASNRSTIHNADLFWQRDIVMPRAEAIRMTLQRKLVPLFDGNLILDFESPVVEDAEHELAVMQAMPRAFTINEWRKSANLGSLGEQGEYFVQSVSTTVVDSEGNELGGDEGNNEGNNEGNQQNSYDANRKLMKERVTAKLQARLKEKIEQRKEK